MSEGKENERKRKSQVEILRGKRVRGKVRKTKMRGIARERKQRGKKGEKGRKQ